MTTPAIVWLLIGGALLALNKVIEKYNLAYAAAAAITIGIFIIMGIMGGDGSEPFIIAQIIFFFIATTVWWYIFREKTIKQTDKEKEFAKAIIGKTVEVGEGGINSISGGNVKWNGRVLPAKLADNVDADTIDAGTKMQVQEIIGNTLIITDKK